MRSVELQSYLAARTQTDVVTYLLAVTGAEQAILGAVGAVQGAVAAQEAVEAASRASVASAPPRAASVPRVAPSGSSGACGGATNGADAYIQRESGGSPTVVNSSSGAYGCFQILPSTWASSCSDLGPESGASATVQAECASRLPLSAWAL